MAPSQPQRILFCEDDRADRADWIRAFEHRLGSDFGEHNWRNKYENETRNLQAIARCFRTGKRIEREQRCQSGKWGSRVFVELADSTGAKTDFP